MMCVSEHRPGSLQKTEQCTNLIEAYLGAGRSIAYGNKVRSTREYGVPVPGSLAYTKVASQERNQHRSVPGYVRIPPVGVLIDAECRDITIEERKKILDPFYLKTLSFITLCYYTYTLFHYIKGSSLQYDHRTIGRRRR